MLGYHVTRRDLIEVLEGSAIRAEPVRMERYELRRGGVVAVYGSHPGDGDLPLALIVADEELKEFLAWTWSYLPQFRPISSLLRVLPASSMRYLDERSEQQSTLGPWVDAYLAGIRCETELGDARQDHGATTSLAYLGSFGYLAARATAHRVPVELSHLFRRWLEVKGMCGQKPFESASQILHPWETLFSLANGAGVAQYDLWHDRHPTDGSRERSVLVATEEEGISGGRRALQALDVRQPLFEGLPVEFPSRREDRVSLVVPLLHRLANAPASPQELPLRDLAAGLAVASIADESLEHMSLLVPFLRAMPTALIWYGILTGLASSRHSLKAGERRDRVPSFRSAPARRLLKEILESTRAVDMVRADISFDELAVITRSGSLATREVPSRLPGILCVEVVPTICTWVHWNGNAANPGMASDRLMADTSHSVSEARDLAQFLLRVLDTAAARLPRGAATTVPSKARKTKKG